MLRASKILICRPQEQADKLALFLQAHHYAPIVFPTIEIQKIEFILSQDFIQKSHVILIQSASSLKYLDAAILSALQQHQYIYAMGKGTEQALLKQGIISKRVGESGWLSEEILVDFDKIKAELKLKNIQRRVLILTGEGGRSVLEPELNHKGWYCKRVNTYKRAAPSYGFGTIQQIKAMPIDLIIITSVDMLKNLLFILKADLLIKNKRLLVISERIKQAALALGWQGEIYVARSAAHEDLLAKIEKI